jgi:hypothetical protein
VRYYLGTILNFVKLLSLLLSGCSNVITIEEYDSIYIICDIQADGAYNYAFIYINCNETLKGGL